MLTRLISSNYFCICGNQISKVINTHLFFKMSAILLNEASITLTVDFPLKALPAIKVLHVFRDFYLRLGGPA